MRAVYLGVDAGNSKTAALACSATGEILGRGRASTGDIYGALGTEQAIEEVCSAVHQALHVANAELGDVCSAAFRLAGIDWDDDEQLWEQAVRHRLPGMTRWSLLNDGFAMLRLGALDGTGVSVIGGTGPAIAARGCDGSQFSASWWIQDPLGGAALGEQAFRTVVRAELGLDAPTAMARPMLELYGQPSVAGLLEAFTRRIDPIDRWDKARAARLVLAAASDGDQSAQGIVARQACGFAEYVLSAARRVGFDPAIDEVPIVLGGSLMTSQHAMFREATAACLRARFNRPLLTSPQGSPVVGALLDALAEGGLEVTESLRTRVQDALHPEEFLRT